MANRLCLPEQMPKFCLNHSGDTFLQRDTRQNAIPGFGRIASGSHNARVRESGKNNQVGNRLQQKRTQLRLA